MFAVDKAGAIQLLDSDVPLAAAKGDLDLNEIARFILAGRGIGRDGTWLGLDESRRQMDELREGGKV